MAVMLSRDLGPEGDRTIFHYTDSAGLEEILRTQSIWASSILYLNDSEEIYGAYRLIRQLVRDKDYSDTDQLFIELAVSRASGTADSIGSEITHGQVYVTSFSGKCDDLSQWRAYASQHGYCIGFAPSHLKKVTESKEFILDKVRYETEDKNVLIKPIINAYLSGCRELDISSKVLNSLMGRWPLKGHHRLMELIEEFRKSSQHIAPLLKDHSFKDEEEWRLISKRGSKQQSEFRVTDNGIIPYREICLLDEANIHSDERDIGVRVVVVGPSQRIQLNLYSSMLLFGRHKINFCTHTATRTPYRTW